MSRFSLDKFKGSGGNRSSTTGAGTGGSAALGSFRFHKSTEDLEKVESDPEAEPEAELHVLHADQQGSNVEDCGNISVSLPTNQRGQQEPCGLSLEPLLDLEQAAATSCSSPDLARDVSPMKERLLGQFARLTPEASRPAPGAANSGSSTYKLDSSEGSSESGSWLTQVKGKLAKTVDSTVERYTELRAERLRSRTAPAATLGEASANSHSFDLQDVDPQLPQDDVTISRQMSHSQSELVLRSSESSGGGTSNDDLPQQQRPHSQIFDLDISDWTGGSTIQEELENALKDVTELAVGSGIGVSSRPSGLEPPVSGTPPLNQETPTKVRKRFGIPFLDRSGATQSPASGSPTKSEVVETPKRSLRSIMRSYVGKSSSAPPTTTSAPQTPSSDAAVSLAPSLTTRSTVEPTVEDPISSTPPLSQPQFPLELPVEEAEEAEEADNMNMFSVENETEDLPDSQPGPTAVTVTPLGTASVHHVQPLNSLLNPAIIVVLAVINFTGLLPLWLSGFLSGIILTVILLVWSYLKIHPPISYARSSQPSSSQITIHEPPVLVECWMNLLPHQYHPYHVDTYEVKQTISVKITIEHHMLKIEYPDKNIPRRLNADEIIPNDLKFHFHTDHIDLTKAKISLLPEGIAGKRMFSKKYPIEIRPNAVKQPECLSSGDTSAAGSPVKTGFSAVPGVTAKTRPLNAEVAKSDQDCISENKFEDCQDSDIDDSQCDADNLEDDDMDMFDGDRKVFYLFARADREKEDIYKALLDGHYFLCDTLLDVSRRHTASTVVNNQELGSVARRETVRERKARFMEFMALILDSSIAGPGKPAEQPDPPMPEEGSGTPKEKMSPFSFIMNNQADQCLHFFNIFLHRIFYDIHKSEEIKSWLKSRIYNKLLKIKITQWFKQIDVTEIYMGTNLPKIKWVSSPTQDDRGLWVEVGVEYGGLASATIETCGFNLGEEAQGSEGGGGIHLKDLLEENKDALPIRSASPHGERKVSSRIEAATNSDEEDSAESDSEESGETPAPATGPGGAAVDAAPAAKTRWWEMVGNSEIVKSGINRLSNSEWFKAKTSKKMTLQLEITNLKGVIVLNFPPPPSDRLWYGFKSRPDIGLRILPYYGDVKLGEDNSFFSTAINKGIEVLVNRLKEEIHKFVLLPNMDDLPIRIMTPLLPTNAERKRFPIS